MFSAVSKWVINSYNYMENELGIEHSTIYTGDAYEINLGSVWKKLNEKKQDLIEILPHELVLGVFSRLNLSTLGSSSCVSKAWKRLTDVPTLWKTVIYRDIAFGNDKWAKCFGPEVVKDEDNQEEFSSLPSEEFIADCKKFKSIFPKRKPNDILMLVRLPKTLNGGLTLKSLGELAKNYFPANGEGYHCIPERILHSLGNKSIDKSKWVFITKDALPESINKSYARQQKIVAELAKKSLTDYEIPGLLEAVACIFAYHFGSKVPLVSNSGCFFIKNPLLYTGYKFKNSSSFKNIVGGFVPEGLWIFELCGESKYGVAALRKF